MHEQTMRPRWAGLPMKLVKLLAALLLLCIGASTASAHVMVAQSGTLNLQGDGAFLVVSLPISAFADVDDDRDGKMSLPELIAHQKAISEAVQQGIRLRGTDGKAEALQGLMLSVSGPDGASDQATTQVLAMGRFALQGLTTPFALEVRLWGRGADEQSIQIKATRGEEAQWLVFTPNHAQRTVFDTATDTLLDFVQLGVTHILTGWDHLLFLLLVLIPRPAWRPALYALSCFTLGHAVTLAICVWGGIRFSSAWVEPAILATIVGLALFELLATRFQRAQASSLRLALVFACALIHGLGLGNSLLEFGLDSRYRLLSMVGFNIGIEIGQIVFSVCFFVCISLLRLKPAYGIRKRSSCH
jgi:hydrogenase/urease accessory protein HupE